LTIFDEKGAGLTSAEDQRKSCSYWKVCESHEESEVELDSAELVRNEGKVL
jgi:hypothetical protein